MSLWKRTAGKLDEKIHLSIPLLFVLSFLSISAFQIVLSLTLFLAILTGRVAFEGKARWGVLLFSVSTFLGTLLFFPKNLPALGEAIFPLIYFWKFKSKREAEESARIVARVLPYVAFACTIAWLMNTARGVEHKTFWGGIFRTAETFSILSLMLLSLFFKKNGKRFPLALLSAISLAVLISTSRRSYFIAFSVTALLLFISLARAGYIKLRYFVLSLFAVAVLSLAFFGVLVAKDPRFAPVREIASGKDVSFERFVSTVSSGRLSHFSRAVEVIKKDIENANLLHLAVGHGPKAGKYMFGKKEIGDQRFESIVFVSEIVERGVLGLAGEIIIAFHAIAFLITSGANILSLALSIPLVTHVFGTIFLFFWSHTLPLYLLLYKTAEKLSQKNER